MPQHHHPADAPDAVVPTPASELKHPAPRPAMTPKPIDELPETARTQPAVTNQTPES